MALYEAGIQLTINFATRKLFITNITDYLGLGIVPDTSFEVYITELKSPDGTVIHENPTSSGLPDFYDQVGIGGNGEITDIATYDDGSDQTGNYIISMVVLGDGDTFLKTDNFAFSGYEKPTLVVVSDVDAISDPPELKLTDNTDYSQENYIGLNPIFSGQQWVLQYPDGIIPEPPDLVVNGSSELITNSFYSQRHAYQYDVNITYAPPGMSILILYDELTISGNVDVLVPQDLCQVYALVNGIYAEYLGTRGITGGNGNKDRWLQAVALMHMIRQSLSCGDTDGLNDYVAEIERIANVCGATPVSGPVLIIGYSVTDNNTVTVAYASNSGGDDFSFIPLVSTKYYGFLSHNKNYTPIQSDYNGLWIKQLESGAIQEASISEDVTSNLGEAVGGIDDQETINQGTTFTDFVKKLLITIFYPTFVLPIFSLSKSVGTLQKIGANVAFTLTFNFDRGQILGDLNLGVWSPALVQDFRSGPASAYLIDGVPQDGNDNDLGVNKLISLGDNVYFGTVDYDIGAQPLDSAGQNFDNPFPAGTSPSESTTIEGVYPLFATTLNITTATEQALISMITGDNIEKTLVAESGGSKQFFDIPDIWLVLRSITKVEFYNTLSGSFDTTDRLSAFTQASTTHTIEGNVVNYTRFINNLPDRGEFLIKIIF